jgi:hypothetical protein
MPATEHDLIALGFLRCSVTRTQRNINHPDPRERGPFCRLAVAEPAPERPGVYVWCVNGYVMYVGKADHLRQITHGYFMGRPFNDYTYMPLSKVRQPSNPRVRVNGLLNRAFEDNLTVSWWWLETGSAVEASRLEAELIDRWNPPWNRGRPSAPPMAATA